MHYDVTGRSVPLGGGRVGLCYVNAVDFLGLVESNISKMSWFL